MYKALLALLPILVLTSCSTSYNIKGSSNLSTLDGQKLYLKVVSGDSLKNIDSCDVVHGEFAFSGNIDSVKMANIYMDQASLIPVVLEDGDVVVKLNDSQQSIGGTPLNDELYKFLKNFDQLRNQSSELVRKQTQAIMNGYDMDAVNRKLAQEDIVINQKIDHLLTKFVTDNFDNVLGPGVFMMVTSAYEYPVLTPWIEDIMSKATAKFKNDPYVKEYCEMAQRNQNIMNGMEEPQAQSDAPAAGTVPGAAMAPPTPNQMAGDSAQTGN